jgi:hypothetical protein
LNENIRQAATTTLAMSILVKYSKPGVNLIARETGFFMGSVYHTNCGLSDSFVAWHEHVWMFPGSKAREYYEIRGRNISCVKSTFPVS